MVVLPDGAYCGLAPVPGGRVNVGIVLAGRAWRERLRRDGAAAVGQSTCSRRSRRSTTTPRRGARAGSPTRSRAPARSAAGSHDAPGPAGSSSATRRGSSTRSPGEGLHRALVSRAAGGGRDRRGAARPAPAGGLAAYDRAMDERFATKDVVSRVVQAFLDRPAPVRATPAGGLRGGHDVRATMGLVMGDLVPASRALDPRFLAGLLRPVTADHDSTGGVVQRVRLAAYAWIERDDAVLLCRIAARDVGAGLWIAAGWRARVRRGPGGRRHPRGARGDGAAGTVDELLGDPVGRPRAQRPRAGTGSTRSGIVYRVTAVDADLVTRSTAPRTWRPGSRSPSSTRCPPSPLVGWARRWRAADALHDRHRHRRAAGARLPAGPRRHPLGAAAPPLLAVGGRPPRARRRRSSATSWRGGRSCPCSGSGIPVTWRSRTWHEPATRRLRFVHVAGATKGMDVTWTIEPTERRRSQGPRVEIAHDFRPRRPGLRRVRGPRLHPAHRGPHARHVPRPRGGARATTSRRRAQRDARADGRRAVITGIGVVSAIGTGLPAFRDGPARGAQPGEAHRPLRPVAVPLARSRPRSTTSSRSTTWTRARPGRSTGSASSGSRPAGWR